jgi:hypothetical protein
VHVTTKPSILQATRAIECAAKLACFSGTISRQRILGRGVMGSTIRAEFAGHDRLPLPAITREVSRGFANVRRGTIFSMLTEQIVALLIAERDKLNRAIEALQGPTKRIGRPPKNPLADAASTAAPAPMKHGRRFSAAQRKTASERMRLRWAAKRKAEAKPTPTPQPTTKKRTMSAAGRKAIRDGVRKRWALIRAGKVPSPFAKRKGEAKVTRKAVSKPKKTARAA